MPSRHLPTSPAVGGFLKDQRKRLGYTLRDVEELSEKAGKLIPFSTLARIEQGKLDPGLPRLQQLLRVYHVPLQAAGDLLDLEEFAGELPEETDPKRLYRLGRDAWQAGNARAGLAAFIALRRIEEGVDPLIRQKAILAFSVAAGTLGKYEFAKHVVDELLLEPPDPTILVSVLVQAAKCWQWLGSSEVALALIDRATGHLTRKSPPHHEAYVFHEKASILTGLKQFQAAEAALATALKAYRRADDETGYCRALAARTRMRFEQGNPQEALLAAQAARMYAERHGIERLQLLNSIEEARAQLLLGNVSAGLSRLGQVLAGALRTDDKVVRFYAHYYYWNAYQKLGDQALASAEFDRAVQHLDFIDEVTPESKHVRELLSTQSRSRGQRVRKD